MNNCLYSKSAITDQICIEIQVYNLLYGLQVFDIVFQPYLMNFTPSEYESCLSG